MCTLIYILLFFLNAAAEQPQGAERPDWTYRQERVVLGGDILHLGFGEGASPEKARFMAEAMAVRNIISECSLAHRDIVIWDRYLEQPQTGTYHAFARAGLSFTSCDEAKRVRGEERRKLSNPELVRNQDLFSELEELEPSKTTWGRVKNQIYQLLGIIERRMDRSEKRLKDLESKIVEYEKTNHSTTVVVNPTKIIERSSASTGGRYRDCIFEYNQQMDEATRLANELSRGNLADPRVSPAYNRALQKLRYCNTIKGK